MGTPDSTTLALVQQLWRQTAGLGLTQAQAKLYSNHVLLSLQQPGLRRFSSTDASARLEEAELLLGSAGLERAVHPEGDWRKAAKRAGELLEWLAHDGVVADGVPASVLAAAAYQVAGYPALARGLLAQLVNEGGIAGLMQSFLQADFPTLLADGHRMLAALSRAGGDDVLDDRLERSIIVETLRCFGTIAASMRWGDEDRLAPALEKLDALAAVGRHSQVPYSAATARLCALVAREYVDASIWPRLKELTSSASDGGRRAFDRFGRAAFQKSRSLAWPSQAVGIERLRTGASFVLCTPTGSGKTTVAELALIGDLLGRPDATDLGLGGGLALYLVPSRALAAEIETRLEIDLATIGDERLIVTGLYGGTDWGPTDAWLTSESPTVLVCTYEKAEALLRFLGPVFMQRVRVVIIDEAHSVQFDGKIAALRTSESRALRLEVLAVRLLRALDGCAYRLIALSAVTAGLEGSLAQWLVGRADAEPAHSDYRSTRQLVGRLECLHGRAFKIYYDVLDRTSLTFADADATPFVPSPFPPHPPAPSCESGGPLVRLRPYLVWAALQLARADADNRRHSVLVSIASHITTYAKSFLTLIEDDWQGVALPTFFVPPTAANEVRLWEECLATAKDYFTEASPEYRLLCHGIAVHHGKMPALLARRLKTIIEAGIVRVVLATSTLSEGVNLPVEYILVPEVHRNNQVIPVREFLNLVGRAGRPGHGTEGRTLVVLPPHPGSSKGNAAYSARRLVEGYRELIGKITQGDTRRQDARAESPLAALLSLLREEWRKLSNDDSDAAFQVWLEMTKVELSADEETLPPAVECLDTLDAVLLAAVEELQQLRTGTEELPSAELEDALRGIWDKTFAKVAASTEGLLSQIFLSRGAVIPTLYPDRKERRRIYKTSLPPLSARELLARVAPIRAHLERGVSYATATRTERYAFVEETVALIAGMPRFAPGPKVGRANADWKAVLYWWLDPGEAPIRPKPEHVGSWHEYAAKSFAYKVNWALGSVISLCLDAVDAGVTPVALSLEDWPESGLPWAAFWLKELLTWGTLEPVAAYLLARGGVITRAEAEGLAPSYYEAHSNDDSNALLDPRKIRDWADSFAPARAPHIAAIGPRAEFDVHLEYPADTMKFEMLRVLPASQGQAGMVDWLDAAGYSVATCKETLLEPEWSVEATDFTLDVRRSKVVVTPYL